MFSSSWLGVLPIAVGAQVEARLAAGVGHGVVGNARDGAALDGHRERGAVRRAPDELDQGIDGLRPQVVRVRRSR